MMNGFGLLIKDAPFWEWVPKPNPPSTETDRFEDIFMHLTPRRITTHLTVTIWFITDIGNSLDTELHHSITRAQYIYIYI